jgi:integrase
VKASANFSWSMSCAICGSARVLAQRIFEARWSHQTARLPNFSRMSRIGMATLGRLLCRSSIAPHDLRRTCAKLCRAGGGELEQIQMLLGHASVQTTERYLGTKQDLVHAPNDAIGLKVPI